MKLSKDYFFSDNYEYIENLFENKKGDNIKKININNLYKCIINYKNLKNK